MGTGKRSGKSKACVVIVDQAAMPGPTLTLHCGFEATLPVQQLGPSSATAGRVEGRGAILVLIDDAGRLIAELDESAKTRDLLTCLSRGFDYRGVLHPDESHVDVEPEA